MWIALLPTLALAQDDTRLNQRLLDPPATEAAPAPPRTAVVLADGAPMGRPAPRMPSSDLILTETPWTEWAWSLGAPVALLLLVGAAGWYVRRNGIKWGGRPFGVVEEGPALSVVARSVLAGQDQVCMIEVSGVGPVRHLLVTAGPGGTRLVADLTATAPPAPTAMATPDDAMPDLISRAVRDAMAATAPPAPPVAPPPVLAAVGVAPRPVASSAPVSVPPYASVEPEIEPRRETRSRAQGVQAFDATFAEELDEAPRPRRDLRAAPPEEKRPDERRSALQGKADWRANAYLATAVDEMDEPSLGELTDGLPRRDARAEPPPARQPGPQRGHLESLARPAAPRARDARSLVKEGVSRQDRTAAARALLENMVARKAQGER